MTTTTTTKLMTTATAILVEVETITMQTIEWNTKKQQINSS